MEQSAPPNVMQITPFMHIADLEAAVSFFVEILGFRAVVFEGNYAYVERDGYGIRILSHRNAKEIGVPHGGYAYYLDVRDLNAIVQELGPKLAGMSGDDVCGPVDQEYGQRELIVRAPDGNFVVFGQAIKA